MYHRIIVPLDGTPFGEYAIPYAAHLAQRTGAVLEVCHVHVHQDRNPDLAALTPYQYEHCIEAEYEFDAERAGLELNTLDQLAERIRARFPITVSTRMLGGHVEAALLQETESALADLVVMATHARAGFARVRLGSVADRLVHRLSRPILLVQPGDALEPPAEIGFRRVLITLDGSPFSEQVLEQVTPLLVATGARPWLLHVVSPLLGPVRRGGEQDDTRVIHRREDAIAYLMTQAQPLAEQGLHPEIHAVVDRSPAAAILNAASYDDVDLICMATHGRGGLTRLVMGSIADQVLRNCRKPILLFRPRPVPLPQGQMTDVFLAYGH
jgi:nucleotide-binding universal stress UspA family protein